MAAADRPPAAADHRADTGAIGGEDAGHRHVDRVGGHQQAGARQAADRHVDPAGRRAAGGAGIADLARGGAAKAKPGRHDVEHRERHLRQAGVDHVAVGGEAAADGGGAAGEGDRRRRQPPAIAIAGHHRGRIEAQRAAIHGALRHDAIAVGGHVHDALQVERSPARAGDGEPHLPQAVAQLRIGGEAREAERATTQAGAVERPLQRGAGRVEHDRQIDPPLAQRRAADELGVAQRQPGLDPLHRVDRAEHDVSIDPAAADREPTVEAVIDDGDHAARARAANIEALDRDLRVGAAGQQDVTGAIEWPEA